MYNAGMSSAALNEVFDLMPVALWDEDFSGIKAIFDSWRAAGITDLRDYLRRFPQEARRCAQAIRVRRVNQRTLDMFGAASLSALIAGMPKIVKDESLESYAEELAQLWEGRISFTSTAINFRLDGAKIDVRVNGAITGGIPGDWTNVIVALEDISKQEEARRDLLASEAEARAMFHDSPVSIWLEDFSAIKRRLDRLRDRGIEDLRTFIDVHPDFVIQCMREIHVLDVNLHTLTLFGAPDKETLLSRLGDVFRDEMRGFFAGQLAELWEGKQRHEREVVNYRLDGEALNLILQFSIMPGREHDWSKVLVSLTDITARKKAEAYLEYLGKHDSLTRLYNRTYFVDEVNRLNVKGPFPVSVMLLDLNGLKPVNDELGHIAGDSLLRRVGEILLQLVDEPACAARIGGDEFVILLPAKTELETGAVLSELARLTALNNQFHSHAPAITFSVGAATCEAPKMLESAIQQADMRMYENKRDFYARARS